MTKLIPRYQTPFSSLNTISYFNSDGTPVWQSKKKQKKAGDFVTELLKDEVLKSSENTEGLFTTDMNTGGHATKHVDPYDNMTDIQRMLYAARQHPTSEIVSYVGRDGQVHSAPTANGALDPEDPIASLYLADKVATPVLKLAGKEMLYGLGRWGEGKALNWARARLISNAMNEAELNGYKLTTPLFTTLSYTATKPATGKTSLKFFERPSKITEAENLKKGKLGGFEDSSQLYPISEEVKNLISLVYNHKVYPRNEAFLRDEESIDKFMESWYAKVTRPQFGLWEIKVPNKLYSSNNKPIVIVSGNLENDANIAGLHYTFTGENYLKYNTDPHKLTSFAIHEANSHGTDKYITEALRNKYLNFLYELSESAGSLFGTENYGGDTWEELRATLNQVKYKLIQYFPLKDGKFTINKETISKIPEKELLDALKTSNGYASLDYSRMIELLDKKTKDRIIDKLRKLLLLPSTTGIMYKINNNEKH